MSFKDDAADDRKGGWTDQGPENDLRMIATGRQILGGVKFDILNPEANGGRSCLAFAGKERPYFLKEAVCPVDANAKFLYLLNAVAWGGSGDFGKIEVSYKDGSKQELKAGNEEAGDWWNPVSRPNGALVWTGENKSAIVGLYMSKYELAGKPLSSVKFTGSEDGPVWLVVAASLSNESLSLPKDSATYVVENAQWRPFDYDRDIVKGSALDFSGMLDAPAGKYGFLKAQDGKFVFEGRPDKPVRFYGTNLVMTANFMEKEWCERLADRLAATGYNAVRVHHFDDILVKKTETSSVELNPEKADQLDYLLFCLKKRGIYLTTDLYTTRVLVKGEIPEFPDKAIDGGTFKCGAFLLDSVMGNWEAFARNYLNHVNPYTGLALKDDPALVSMSLINEDTLFGQWYREGVNDLFGKRFEKWLGENKHHGFSKEERQRLRTQFIMELYAKGYERMEAFVRKLGVKVPLTDQNHWCNAALTPMRRPYDYVDNHFYWDHPKFLGAQWRLPVLLTDGARSAISARAAAPGKYFPSRILGKPFAVTEFNYSYPNQFRAEGGALTGAYAGLQDWDALYRFAYAHHLNSVKEPRASVFFDTSVDPINAISERMAVMLFLRGDVKSSELTFPVLVSERCRDTNELPKEIWQLGLVGKTGSIVLDKELNPYANAPKSSVAFTGIEAELKEKDFGLPFFLSTKESSAMQSMIDAGKVDKSRADLEDGRFLSSTGEIAMDSKAQTFKVVTGRSETLILPEGMAMKGEALSVENKLARGVFFASSLDGAALKESKRILILHLTDSHCAKDKFSGPDMGIWEKSGTLPYLIRQGEARISLSGDFASYALYGLDMAGKRLAEIPFEKGNGGIAFNAKVSSKAGTFIAYELAKKDGAEGK